MDDKHMKGCMLSFKRKEMQKIKSEVLFSPLRLSLTLRFHETQCCLGTGMGARNRKTFVLLVQE